RGRTPQARPHRRARLRAASALAARSHSAARDRRGSQSMSVLLPEPASLGVFLVAMFLVNITPGPDMLYVIGRSVGQGRGAGLVGAVGIGTGCIVHIVAAALGLAAVLEHAPLAFEAIKYAGAVYLVWIGIQAWRTASAFTAEAARRASLRTAFVQGFVTNVT